MIDSGLELGPLELGNYEQYKMYADQLHIYDGHLVGKERPEAEPNPCYT